MWYNAKAASAGDEEGPHPDVAKLISVRSEGADGGRGLVGIGELFEGRANWMCVDFEVMRIAIVHREGRTEDVASYLFSQP